MTPSPAANVVAAAVSITLHPHWARAMEAISSPAPAAARAGALTLPASLPGASAMACAGFAAAWRGPQPDAALEAAGEAVRVLVPLGNAALRVALPPPAGAAGFALIREPGICILPPAARVEAALEAPGKLLVLVLEAADWRERARAALGHFPELRSAHAGPDAFVSRIAGMLDARREAGGPADPAWLSAIADDLAIHLATRYGRPAEAPAFAGLAPHRLQRVLALVEERLDGPIPVQDLAAAVHMSPYHFARMFKQSTGQPPHHYITWQRMDRAKDLLARSELALAEIAARVGYRTQAHFTGVFHARVGVTPRAYRLRCRAGQV